MPDNPIPYPLDPVVVGGTLITLDQYVNAPTVITRRVAEIAAQRFFASKVFSPGPAITGGALLFERPNPLLTDLYAARRTQEMAPGTQAPVLTFVRGIPMVARPRKIGGKWSLTKEERQRNNPRLAERAMVQMANTITRDLEIMALSELNAVVASEGRTIAAGSTWAAAAATTFGTRTAANQPASDIANVVSAVDVEERGHVLNSAIFNPLDWANLKKIYASLNAGNGDASARAVLTDNGITTIDTTPRQPQGRVKLYEAGMVGTWSNEFPLTETTWFDEETDMTWWYQSTVSPAFAVDDQFAMLELVGV